MASLAVLFAGGSVVPVNTCYTPVEAGDLVTRAGCRVVVAQGELRRWSLAREAATMPGPHTVVSRGADAPGLASWAELTGAGSSSPALDRRMAALTAGDMSHVQYTSGTTGAPKGAMSSSRRHGADHGVLGPRWSG